MSEPNETRRGLALNLVADNALDPSQKDFTAQATKLSGGGFDVVFEASGAVPAVRSSLDLVRRGGSIVQIGTVGGNEVTLPVNDLMVREISLLGSFRYADEFPAAIQMVSSGRISFEGLVTATFPLTRVADAFENATDCVDSLKIQLIVSDG